MRSPKGSDQDLHASAGYLIHTLQEQCAAVSTILNDVLSLQKMEDGQFNLEFVPFSPELFVRKTVESFRPAFEAKRLQVHISIQDNDNHVNKAESHSAGLEVRPGESAVNPMAVVAATAPGLSSSPVNTPHHRRVSSSPAPVHAQQYRALHSTTSRHQRLVVAGALLWLAVKRVLI